MKIWQVRYHEYSHSDGEPAFFATFDKASEYAIDVIKQRKIPLDKLEIKDGYEDGHVEYRADDMVWDDLSRSYWGHGDLWFIITPIEVKE